jgi:ATP adenylyltransferase
MDRIWSPWRYAYVSQAAPSDACFFCEKSAEARDRENYVVFRGKHNLVLLNSFPYTTGHLLIAPYAHQPSLQELPAETLHEMILLAQAAERHLRAIYKPQGLNLGVNIGECAGAGVAGHIHMHVLPRWPADSNFMTTVGETRVLPENLGDTWEKLQAAFHRG